MTDTPADLPSTHPGVEDGTLVDTTVDGQAVQEKVVYDKDESGNVVGWHKESVA